MTLGKRLDRLEGNRLPEREMQELDLPPDLCARIEAAKAAGLGLAGLQSADLEAIVAAADVARGRA